MHEEPRIIVLETTSRWIKLAHYHLHSVLGDLAIIAVGYEIDIDIYRWFGLAMRGMSRNIWRQLCMGFGRELYSVGDYTKYEWNITVSSYSEDFLRVSIRSPFMPDDSTIDYTVSAETIWAFFNGRFNVHMIMPMIMYIPEHDHTTVIESYCAMFRLHVIRICSIYECADQCRKRLQRQAEPKMLPRRQNRLIVKWPDVDLLPISRKRMRNGFA